MDESSKDRGRIGERLQPKRKEKRRDKAIRPRTERPLKDRMYSPSTSVVSGQTLSKTPFILTKQGAEKNEDSNSATPPVILAIQKREPSVDSHPQSSPIQDVSLTQSNISSKPSDISLLTDSPRIRREDPHDTSINLFLKTINTTVIPTSSIEIINENFGWSDKALEFLSDRQDFLVVGTVGLQGTGKSTIMSLLANGTLNLQRPSDFMFAPQSHENCDLNSHQTNGVSLGITEERIILLDTQPILSPSVLEQLLRHERKIPSELSTAELCLDMQALQILTFLFTVCHVVLVVQDHFFDPSLFRLLSTAVMLKPSSGSQSNSDCASSTSEELDEYSPHVVFIYNNISDSCFDPSNVEAYCMMTEKLMDQSRLKVNDGISSIDEECIPSGKLETLQQYKDLNLFMLPRFANPNDFDEIEKAPLTFKGHASFEALVPLLRSTIFSVQRQRLTHHTLTERNWFHYAFRTWDSIKKSNILAEYQRLLAS